MSLASLLTDTVTRLRAPLVSGGYGNQSRDWANATSTDYPAHVSSVSSTEDIVNQQQTVTRWKCTVGPDADLEATDRIVWRQNTYDIDGDVQSANGMRGLHHQRVVLMRANLAAG